MSDKVGRPTLYDPAYCERLVEHMAAGYSYESFAGVLSISRVTLYGWEKANPEFLYAKRLGSEKNLMFWEQAGHKGLFEETEYNEQGKPIRTSKLNSTVWVFSMKNRHKWTDKQEIDAKVDDVRRDKIKSLSTEELKALVAANTKDGNDVY